MGVFEVGDSWIQVLMPKNGLKGSEGDQEGPQTQWEGTGGS